MRVFAGIPVPEIKPLLLELEKKPKFSQNMRLSRMEPHLTIIPPTDIENAGTWIATVTKSLAVLTAIRLKPIDVDWIGNNVLMVHTDPDPLQPLHMKLNEVSPQEEQQFRPHITIGRPKRSFRAESRTEILEEARSIFGDLGPIDAASIRLYSKENGQLQYKTLKDVDLAQR